MFKRGYITLFILFLIVPGVLTADNYEFRNYLTLDYRLINSGTGFTLKPFIKVEERFRDFGIVLDKFNIGVKAEFLRWLGVDVFYSRKELFYSEFDEKDLFTINLVFSFHLHDLSLKNRNGNEWHLSDEYFRYRNYTEAIYKIDRKYGIYISEEFRIDSDERRVNQNDIRIGAEIRSSGKLKLRIFIAQESKRRHSKISRRTYYVGLSAVTHILR